MKTYESAQAQPYSFLPSELDGGEWSVSCPGHARPRESFQHTLDKRTGGLQQQEAVQKRGTSILSPILQLSYDSGMVPYTTVNQNRRNDEQVNDTDGRLTDTFMFLTALSCTASLGYSDLSSCRMSLALTLN